MDYNRLVSRDDYLRSRYKKRKIHVAPRSVVVVPRRPADAPLPRTKPDIREIWKIHDAAQHLPRFPRLEPKIQELTLRQRKILLVGFIFLIGVVAFILARPSHSTKTLTSNAAPTGINIDKPPEKPDFTVYYPGPLPDQLKINNSSIAYSKGRFGFRINGSSDPVNFYVSEQIATENFNLQTLKAKLQNPQDFNVFIGPATIGVYKNGIVTAVVTKDKTLIILNCAGTGCVYQSRILANALQINTNESLYNPLNQ